MMPGNGPAPSGQTANAGWRPYRVCTITSCSIIDWIPMRTTKKHSMRHRRESNNCPEPKAVRCPFLTRNGRRCGDSRDRAKQRARRTAKRWTYAVAPRRAAHGEPRFAHQHIVRNEVVARDVEGTLTDFFERAQSSGAHAARDGGKPVEVLAVIPRVEVGLVIGVDAGLDDVVIACRFARRCALQIQQQ